MFNVIKKFFTNIERYNHPKRTVDLLLELVTKLDPRDFQGIQSSDKSILYINVPYLTIMAYQEEVTRGYICLKTGVILSLSTLQDNLKSIPISEFFLNPNGCYIDEEARIKAFNNVVRDFANLYQDKLDTEETNSGVDRHNLRHLSLMISNLYELYREFSKITVA